MREKESEKKTSLRSKEITPEDQGTPFPRGEEERWNRIIFMRSCEFYSGVEVYPT